MVIKQGSTVNTKAMMSVWEEEDDKKEEENFFFFKEIPLRVIQVGVMIHI